MTSWEPVTGENVEPVRDAINELIKKTGSYDKLKAAVEGARFAVRPQAASLDVLADNWDYQPMPDTWTDTVQRALFMRLITRGQYQELADIAQFVEAS